MPRNSVYYLIKYNHCWSKYEFSFWIRKMTSGPSITHSLLTRRNLLAEPIWANNRPYHDLTPCCCLSLETSQRVTTSVVVLLSRICCEFQSRPASARIVCSFWCHDRGPHCVRGIMAFFCRNVISFRGYQSINGLKKSSIRTWGLVGM